MKQQCGDLGSRNSNKTMKYKGIKEYNAGDMKDHEDNIGSWRFTWKWLQEVEEKVGTG